MQLYEPPSAVPQLHQALDALGRAGAHVLPDHDAALAEIYVSVHEGVAVISHIRVCGYDVLDFGLLYLTLRVLTVDVLDGLMQLLGQVRALDGRYGVVLTPVLRAFGGGSAEHHLRVVEEVLIDLETVLILTNVHPLWKLSQRHLAALEEDDVRHDVGSRIGAESVVWQPDCAQQLATLSEIPPGTLVFRVHRVARGYKRDNAARTHLFEHLGGEVVVDAEAEAVVLWVKHLIISERHVADCNVKEPVGEFRVLKAGYLYVCVGVKLLRNAPGDAVQLYTVELTVSHAIWQEAKEIAHAAGRLEYAPTFKAQIDERIIDGANNCRRGVVRVERGTAHGLVFLGRERGFQL